MKLTIALTIMIIFIEAFNILGEKKYQSLSHRFSKILNSRNLKVSRMDKLQQMIQYTSGIRKYLKNLNVYNFLLIIVSIGILSLFIVYELTQLWVPSLFIAVLLCYLPLFILECFIQYGNKLLTDEMVTFISIMARWSYVKDDVYYCFEKASEKVNQPLSGYIIEFLNRVKYSGDIQQSFEWMLMQSDNELYRNLLINLQQTETCKGDLCQLLDRLEEEAYRIEGEHVRRQSETYWDRIVIYCTIIVVFLLGISILMFNLNMRDFYLYTDQGQYLLSLYVVLYFLGVYVTSKITTFNY